MFGGLLASARAAEYEKILRKAIAWAEENGDNPHIDAVVVFCTDAVWPSYLEEKKEAFEFIPDDLKKVFEPHDC